MSFALRVVVMLAAVTPLFAATAFRPTWWQTLIAAMIGSALGQLAVRATRGRRVAAWSVAVVATMIAATAGAWSLTHGAAHDAGHAGSPRNDVLVVRSTSGNFSLTWEDVRAIQTEIPSIHLAAPYLHKAVQLIHDEQNWNTGVVGTTPEYLELRNLHVVTGAMFEPGSHKEVVLGETVVARLFAGGQSAVGEAIRINSAPIEVVGVLAHQGMSPQGQDLDDVALVPVEVFTAKIDGMLRFDGAVLVAASSVEMARVEAELRRLLRDRHRLAAGTDDDFIIRSPEH